MVRVRLAVLAVAVAVSCGACGSAGDSTGEPSVETGKPGQIRTTTSPGEKTQPQSNDADVEFVRAMLVHRGQRLAIARLAPRRAKNAQVRALAKGIGAAQPRRIDRTKAWLKTHAGSKNPDDTNDVPGLVTKDQMDRLTAAKGAMFDRLFLRALIVQDEAALKMAQDVQLGGIDTQVQDMAGVVISTYSDEIARLRAIRA